MNRYPAVLLAALACTPMDLSAPSGDPAAELRRAAVRPMTLLADEPRLGQVWTLTAMDAPPHQLVDFYVSLNGEAAAGSGPRLRSHGRVRSGLNAPAMLLPGSPVLSDGDGTAVLEVPVPDDLAPGTDLTVEAVSGTSPVYQSPTGTWQPTGDESCIDDALEPDDDRSAPTWLSPNDTVDLRACDDDWIRIWLEEGDDLTAVISFDPSEADLDLEVFRPGETAAAAASTGVLEFEEVRVVATTSGFHLVHVWTYADFGGIGADYHLAVPVVAAPPVLHRGTLTLHDDRDRLDLDHLEVLAEQDVVLLDLLWLVWPETTGPRQALRGAAGGGVRMVGSEPPSYADCADRSLYPVSTEDTFPGTGALRTGSWACVKSGDGRTGRMRITGQDAAAETLSLDLTVWDDPGARTVVAWGGGVIGDGEAFDFEYGIVVPATAPADLIAQSDALGMNIAPLQGALIGEVQDGWPTLADPVRCEGVSLGTAARRFNGGSSLCVQTRLGKVAAFSFVEEAPDGGDEVRFQYARWD